MKRVKSTKQFGVRQSLFIAGMLITGASAQAAALPSYQITDLGNLSGGSNSSTANGINDLGQIVGSEGSTMGRKAFIWNNSTGFQYLGAVSTSPYSDAYDINNNGQVVGLSADLTGITRATLWSAGNAQHISGLSHFTSGSTAYAINDAGVIVGTGYDAVQPPQAFSWSSSNGAANLSNLNNGVGAEAYDISESGQIAGTAFDSAFRGRSVIWNQDGTQLEDRGYGRAYGINEGGLSVGSENNPRPSQPPLHAVRWNNCNGCFPVDAISYLGDLPGNTSRPLGSEANAINDKGLIVGTSDVTNAYHAFIWTPEEGMLDLNSLVTPDDPLKATTTLLSAIDINNSGQIVGVADFSGVTKAFLLTPVPEPATWYMLAIGLGLVGFAARRRGFYWASRGFGTTATHA